MSLASSSVAPHLKTIRVAGFCEMAPPRPGAPGMGRCARLLHLAYCWNTAAMTTIYVLQHVILTYQEWGNVARVSRVMYAMFSFSTCVAKQYTFRLRQRRIDRLLASLDDALFNQEGAEYSRMLLETARGGLMLKRFFMFCGVCTVSMWVIFPIGQRLQGQAVEFSYYTFVDVQRTEMFVLVVMHLTYMTVLLSIGNTTLDTFIGTLLYQCQTQVRIMRMNFETLTDRAKKISEETNEKYTTMLHKLLVQCILHFQKTSEVTDEILDVFGSAVMVQFGVGGWMMCTAAYTLISTDVRGFDFLGSLFFIISVLVELYIYCYFGNEVTLESERVVEAIYSMEWVGSPLWFQKALVLVMERAKRPLRPIAVGLIPLSNDTYVKILKSTYSLFSVLRQTK